MVRRFAFLTVALVLAGVLALAVREHGSVAEAHALLERADPPVNAQVREPPTILTLYFSEPLERRFSGVRVVDQNDARVDDRVEFDASDNALMRVLLKPLSPGYVTVFWENVSAVDGHRISGSYPLTVLNPDGSLPAGAAPIAKTASTSGEEAKPARVVVKWLLLVAGCGLAGVFAFLLLVTPGLSGAAGETARRALDRRGVTAATLCILVLGLAGSGELLLQASNIGASVSDVFATRWGERWLLRHVLLLVPLASIGLLYASQEGGGAKRLWAGIGLLGSAGYLAVTSSVSHSAAGVGAFWGATSDFIHLLAASVWIGMLAMLVVTFIWASRGLERAGRYTVLSTSLQRFSVVAVWSVALLLVSGTVNAIVEVGRLGDLLNTGYGRALLLKLLLLVPLLGIGATNAYVLRPRLVGEEASQRRSRQRESTLADLESRLSLTVKLELGVALAVLAVVALLVQLTPTRGRLAAPVQTGGKFVDSASAGEIAATLVIDPNLPGINSFEVYLTGAVDVVESVRLDFSRPGGDEARLIMDASNPPTFYVGRGPYLAQPGKWRVAIDMRRSRGNDLLIPFIVTVGGPTAVSEARRGGDFASPVSFTAVSVALLSFAALAAAVIVAGSVTRPGLPAGYLGRAIGGLADRVGAPSLRPVWSLALLLAVGIGIGLLVGAHAHQRVSQKEAAKGNPVPTSPASIEKGRMLFAQNCTQCHGETGRGDGPLASQLRIPPANLYDHVPYHPDQFFFQVITNGLSGVMPAFGSQISDEDRWNILNFLRDQFGQPPATR